MRPTTTTRAHAVRPRALAAAIALLTGLAAIGLAGGGPATAAVEPSDGITTIAGDGSYASTGDDGPATAAQVSPNGYIDEAPPGSLYAGSVFLTDDGTVRRIRPDGTIVRFAGGGSENPDTGTSSALDVGFGLLSGVVAAPDGTVYVAAFNPAAVYAVAPSGAVTRRDGPGTPEAYLDTLRDIAVAPDGTVFVVDSAQHAVYRIALDGTISVEIGVPRDLGRGLVYAGDPAVPVNRKLTSPRGVALTADGSTLYVADTNSHGVVESPVGDPGASTYITPDPGDFANQTSFVRDVDVTSDGTVYAHSRGRISRLAGGGVQTIAGDGVEGSSPDGAPASGLRVSSSPGGLAVSTDGERITFVDGARIRRIGDPPPPPNDAPVVAAGDDIAAETHRPIALSGSATDADGTIASVEWTLPDGSSCTIDDAASLETTLRCTEGGTVVVALTATDDGGATASDTTTVTVTAPPVTCAADGTDLAIDVPYGDTLGLASAGGDLVVDGDTGGTEGCAAIDLTTIDAIAITGDDGGETVSIQLGGPFGPGATTEGTGTSEIEITADLGAEDDSVVVLGRPGADRLTSGTLGTDLNGDKDADLTVRGVESITFDGLGGDDRLSAGGTRGTAKPSPVPHVLLGGDGDDVLIGGAGDDLLDGAGDDDDLFGSAGADDELGGPGADTTQAGAVPDGPDLLDGGEGHDEVLYDARTAPVTVVVDGEAISGADGEGDTVAGQEVVSGGYGGDHLSSAVFAVQLRGNKGDDTLVGSPEGDSLLGGDGADDLDGAGGDDLIEGGAGDDTEAGGDGADTFRQGAVASGADTLVGGEDSYADTVVYSRSTRVTVHADGSATSGADGEGDSLIDLDVFRLGSGADVFRGTDRGETVYGGHGGDDLDGAGGDDTLYGEAGNDRLVGGPGSDVLNGAAGTDRCAWVTGEDTRSSCEIRIA